MVVSVRFNLMFTATLGVLHLLLFRRHICSIKFTANDIATLCALLLFGVGSVVFSIQNSQLTGIRYGVYILFFVIPTILAVKSIFSAETFLRVLRIISLLLFSVFIMGFISAGRYQQVGNQLVYSFIAINNFYAILWILAVLIVGSRQSLLAIILVSLAPHLLKRIWLKISLVILAFFVLIKYKLDLIAYLSGTILADFSTVSRVLYKINTPGEEGRLDIWSKISSSLSWFPQGHNYVFHNDNLPHNLFLEILLVFGFILGIPLVAFIFFSILNKVRAGNLYVLAAVVPAMISNGPGAYKYLFLFLLLPSAYENIHSKLQ